jgi:hypothetical protein
LGSLQVRLRIGLVWQEIGNDAIDQGVFFSAAETDIMVGMLGQLALALDANVMYGVCSPLLIYWFGQSVFDLVAKDGCEQPVIL